MIKWADQSQRDLAYTAMCMWEAVLDAPAGPWGAWREANGTHALRTAITDLAEHAESAWAGMDDEAQDAEGAYDWEWIPMWLAMAVDWDHDTNWPRYKGESK